MRILTVVGARPQFVKAAVVSKALAATSGIEEILLHTGQHYDAALSSVFFEELGLRAPDHWLGVGSGSHAKQTARMLEGIEAVLEREKPRLVLVYGDTNSTLAGALAAAKLGVPVAHVEAGLRSGRRTQPEEINRVIADHLAALLLAPTRLAMENLAREGIPARRVLRVGDVMYDAVLQFGEIARQRSGALARLGLAPRGFVLATLHRAENTDDPHRLEVAWSALCALAAEMPVVLPLHPRTRERVSKLPARLEAPASLHVMEPAGYLDMLALEHAARLIVTDSGGVQKEAFFCRVPCVTLRDETEWVELVTLGWNRLVPLADAEAVVQALHAALAAPPGREPDDPPYGDGRASEKIAVALLAAEAEGLL